MGRSTNHGHGHFKSAAEHLRNYRDELEKASGSADNMRRQIKDYLEDAASAKMAAEETRRENASLKRRIDELERRLRRAQTPLEDA